MLKVPLSSCPQLSGGLSKKNVTDQAHLTYLSLISSLHNPPVFYKQKHLVLLPCLKHTFNVASGFDLKSFTRGKLVEGFGAEPDQWVTRVGLTALWNRIPVAMMIGQMLRAPHRWYKPFRAISSVFPDGLFSSCCEHQESKQEKIFPLIQPACTLYWFNFEEDKFNGAYPIFCWII